MPFLCVNLCNCVTIWVFLYQFSITLCLLIPFCPILYLHVGISFYVLSYLSIFFFSVSASFYLFLSVSPGTGSIAKQISVQTMEPDCLGSDHGSVIYCMMTLYKSLNISVLQFSHLKYEDDTSPQPVDLLGDKYIHVYICAGIQMMHGPQ